MRISTNFIIQEFIPPSVYFYLKKIGKLKFAYRYIDSRCVETCESYRTLFGGKVVVNNWWWQYLQIKDIYSEADMAHDSWWENKYPHIFIFRGFRPHNCKIGSEVSYHRFGQATDCDIYNKHNKRVKPEKARKKIIKNSKRFPYVAALEKAVNWIHTLCDLRAGKDIMLISGK